MIELVLASVPASMFVVNAFFFRRLRPAAGLKLPPVSVLIPARNEEASIGEALRSVLASTDVELEVIVLDDGSSDRTAEIVRSFTGVRLETAPPLPPGWNGKQHACFVLASLARHQRLCFLDADVRLEPDAMARMLAAMEHSGTSLLSGFPRQIVVTPLERLLIPMIHFVLLGFLPMPGLRWTRHPAFAAGCGQLMLVRRDAYERSGGHSMLKASMHDGLRLPSAFRQAGFATDIFDATDAASVRMYTSACETWFGLGKNAVEGLAAPQRLPIFTVLLFGGQVLPFLIGAGGWGIAMVLLPRIWAAWKFRQPLDSALLHPLGVTVLLVLQWWALVRHLRGRPARWKDRTYVFGR